MELHRQSEGFDTTLQGLKFKATGLEDDPKCVVQWVAPRELQLAGMVNW